MCVCVYMCVCVCMCMYAVMYVCVGTYVYYICMHIVHISLSMVVHNSRDQGKLLLPKFSHF